MTPLMDEIPRPVEGFTLMHDRLQFDGAVPDEAHEQAAAWLAEHPGTALRFYGNYGGKVTDTEWLRYYPTQRRFLIDSVHQAVPDLAGLRYLPDDLEALTLQVPGDGQTAALLARCTELRELLIGEHRSVPTEVARLTHLDSYGLVGPASGPLKSLEPLPDSPHLRSLHLGSVTVPDLVPVTRCTELEQVSIYLGGTTDLAALADLPGLKRLTIVMVRGLCDLSFLAGCAALESLRLEAMRNVTQLPDLSGLTALREVELTTMKGLDDLTPLASAPALQRLRVFAAHHLTPQAFEPLVGHPALAELRAGLGSQRKNDAVAAMFRGLGEPR